MRSTMRAWGLSLAAFAAAIVLRWLLDPILGNELPLVTTFGAVAAAVWVGGYRPALAVALVSYLAVSYLFIDPRGSFIIDFPRHTVGLVAYLFTCSLIIGFGESVRRAYLLASERREVLRVTLQSIGDGVITTDIRGQITYLNPVAESLTGWSVAEATGQPLDRVFRIINEETRGSVENPATRALRDGVVIGLANHTILIRKDGSECPIDDSAAPIKDERGRVSGCVLIFRDVTVQRQADRDRASQLHTARLLAAMVEASDDAIVSKSLDGIIQSWNAGAERIFGYSAADAVGKHISLVIPPERLAEEDAIVASLKAGRRIDHFETERVRSDGKRVVVSLSISPIKDAAGTVVGASKIARDVTERRKLEDSLRQLASDLSETNRRKDEFLAMLAHELRNPLAPISNAVQVLRMGDGEPDAVKKVGGLLERQVRQMARLVDDLLDMSRITRGRIELRKQRTDLMPVIHQAVEAAQTWCSEMNHNLTVTQPDEPLILHADPARLAQVLGNLINNACKFTDRGGRIQLIAERDGNEAVIRVQDNGIGITSEQHSRIFDMFAQVDTSLERSRDGLGIGLTLVRTVVEQHGGTVSVSSEGLGRGSEFIVRLPLMTEPLSDEVPWAPPETEAIGKRRVLIVDDNADSAQSLAMLLELSGHETHTAGDGLEGLTLAEQARPDVVLLDIGLPRLNGYEVCRRIREQTWGRDIVIAALTGWGQEEDRQRSREAGFTAHLVKPVELSALMKLLAADTRVLKT